MKNIICAAIAVCLIVICLTASSIAWYKIGFDRGRQDVDVFMWSFTLDPDTDMLWIQTDFGQLWGVFVGYDEFNQWEFVEQQHGNEVALSWPR